MRESHGHTWRWMVLVLVFLTALAVRTLRATQIPMVTPDVIRYIEQARMLTDEPVRALREEVYHPLYSVAILAMRAVLLSLGVEDGRAIWVWAGQTVGVICGSLMALLIFRLARLFGARFSMALAGPVAWVVGRRTSAYGPDGNSDMLALCLFAAAMLAAIAAMRGLNRRPFAAAAPRADLWRFLLAGLCAGLAYLARPEGLAAPLIVILSVGGWWLWRRIRPQTRASGAFKLLPRRPPDFRRMVAGLAMMALGVSVPALPYMLIIDGVTQKKQVLLASRASVPVPVYQGGQGVLTRLGDEAITGPPPIGDLAGADKPAVQWVWNEVCKTFGSVPMAVLLLPILWRRRFWGRRRVRLLVIVWAALWYAVMFWLLLNYRYLDGRHTLPLQVAAFALLGVALQLWELPARRCLEWWSKRRGHGSIMKATAAWRRWPKVWVAVILGVILAVGLFDLRRTPWSERMALVRATDWVRHNVAPEVLICDRQRLVGYFSGNHYARWNGDPADPRLDIIQAIREAWLSSRRSEPVIMLGVTYERGQEISSEIGQFRAVATFAPPPGSVPEDMYVLYARRDDPWRRALSSRPVDQ